MKEIIVVRHHCCERSLVREIIDVRDCGSERLLLKEIIPERDYCCDIFDFKYP